jgi:hypothetical protein
MGKRMNARRRELFDRLREEGRLQVPVYSRRSRATVRPERVVVVETVRSECCLVKYAGELPNGFRPCPGCEGA